MSAERVWTTTAWTDWLPNWSRDTKVAGGIVAALLGIHGIVHVLLAPDGHLQLSLHDIGVMLWSLTILVTLGGLVALGRAYTSLASHLETEPQVDLEILPEDERCILEPVLDTPGITQVEVAAKSDFSDAKVSQTLKALRERGLVYREPQGRTYRLYPGSIFSEAPNES